MTDDTDAYARGFEDCRRAVLASIQHRLDRELHFTSTPLSWVALAEARYLMGHLRVLADEIRAQPVPSRPAESTPA